MKRTLRIFGLIGLFFVSFLVFLFLTFPYEVLKETVAAEVSKATGYLVRIGDLGPSKCHRCDKAQIVIVSG